MVKRQVISNWRRALELLASSADGTEAILFAHGFTEATIAGLIDTGLVTTTTKRVLAGQRNVELFMITGRGRAALEPVTQPIAQKERGRLLAHRRRD
jgi:hypothetical protein